MTGEERIRQWLQTRGVRPDLVQGGVRGLVERWEGVAAVLEAGYQRGLANYANDLDTRQLLADALALADDELRRSVAARVDQIDARVRAASEPIDFCVWGERVQRDEGWTAETNWWYFLRPRKMGRELREELKELATDFD